MRQTHADYLSRWEEDAGAVPRFLWNAKMRFGKTITSYQLARMPGAKRVLVVDALPQVHRTIGPGFKTKSITLSCGALTTGVTVAQWSSIQMLRNLKSPEIYFQASFRVQSPWSIKNPEGDDPNREELLKPVCFVVDFAPTRALRQLSEYAVGLSPNESNPEERVQPRKCGPRSGVGPAGAGLQRCQHKADRRG